MNILLAMIPAFFWGTTYAVSQLTLPDWPPLFLGAIRALPAGIILLMFKPKLPRAHEWGRLLVLGTINIAAFFCMIFIMANNLPSAISSVGMVTVPVFAIIMTYCVYRVKPGKTQLLASVIIVTSTWFLFDPSKVSLSVVGIVAMLVAILCLLIGSMMTKFLANKMDWKTVLAWQLIIGGFLLSFVSVGDYFLHPEQYNALINHIEMKNLLGIVWIVIINTVIAYGLYVWLLQRMSVVDITFGSIANPIAGILAGSILMHESFTPFQYLLMLIMIIASMLPQMVAKLTRHVVKVKQAVKP
ncbi:MAG: EamA family transporter [Aliivibrio sp.]|uniref:DMT family transporter n=1 Tax=Aliivibrio sp. TaxID=1872443 RepID=UPI001A372071|nr:EamA family transporter [Aliivibrio sp.]